LEEALNVSSEGLLDDDDDGDDGDNLFESWEPFK
jgi:hypothetical protein